MIHTFSYTQYPKLLTRQLESSIWGYLIMSLKNAGVFAALAESTFLIPTNDY